MAYWHGHKQKPSSVAVVSFISDSEMLPPLSPLRSEPPLLSLPLQPLSLTHKLINTYISSEFLASAGNGVFKKKKKTQPWLSSSSSSSSSSARVIIVVVRAIKEESQQFEVDPDKAREALKNLDQQFQARSHKQVRSRPKTKAPYVNLSRNQTQEAAEEFSGSFFTYTVVALFAFTIFYNVLFYTVIKPSIDGFSEEAPTTSVAGEIPK